MNKGEMWMAPLCGFHEKDWARQGEQIGLFEQLQQDLGQGLTLVVWDLTLEI